MKNANDKERFIELRAEGRSYADIAVALKVSKPTLIAWGKELQKDILNARTLRMDELFEKYAVAKSKRVEVFGKRLEAIMAVLDTRDLSDCPTPTLLALALKYGENLRAEYEPLKLLGKELSWQEASYTEPEAWSA
jgi:DNA-binding Lrp family transcriptional regulator